MTDPASSDRIRVRDARGEDLVTIVNFNAELARETENKLLDQRILAAGVGRALENPETYLRYWVAEIGECIVGQVAVSREWSDWRNGWIWWLQSVFVDAPYRGQGVLRAIYSHLRAAASERGDVIGLRLYVEDGNERAQQVYRALGFQPGGYQLYEDFWIDILKEPG